MDLLVAPADPKNLEAINDLIAASKRTWDYPPAYLAAAIPLLRVDADYLVLNSCFEARSAQGLVGFAAMEWQTPMGALLDHLWVAPAARRRGVGRRLLAVSVAEAVARGFTTIQIIADPPAEGFYLRLGAERIGQKPSRVAGGPVFPVLELRTGDAK